VIAHLVRDFRRVLVDCSVVRVWARSREVRDLRRARSGAEDGGLGEGELGEGLELD